MLMIATDAALSTGQTPAAGATDSPLGSTRGRSFGACGRETSSVSRERKLGCVPEQRRMKRRVRRPADAHVQRPGEICATVSVAAPPVHLKVRKTYVTQLRPANSSTYILTLMQ